jgi:S1-C subfamily serine protease
MFNAYDPDADRTQSWSSDPDAGDETPPWPPPTGSTLILELEPVAREARRSPYRRRHLALGALAVVAIAGGTVGGAIAGRSTQPKAAPVANGNFNTTSVTSVTSLAPATSDVSTLIKTTLPGVVSISVDLNGGHAAGTGFVISSDGQIATNAHVVADATNIQVKFADGSTATATLLGADRTDDLAVVKVDKVGLTALALGTSADLRMGEPVVAIGNALDLTGGPTATEGIVSALNRTIDTNEGEHLTHLIQTDAAINPGNSGGPLLTLDGKVVGINSAGSQDAQNIGFAIAVDTARPIVEQLQQGKAVTKAYLGVSTTAIDASVVAQEGLDVDHGLLIVDITSGSAAAAAGLKPGDVIVSINGTATNDNTTLGDIIRSVGAGHVVHLTVHRNAKNITVDATLSTHAA